MRSSTSAIAAAAVVLALVVSDRVGWAAPAADAVGQRIVAIEFVCASPIDERGLRTLLPVQVGDVLADDTVERTRGLLQQTDIFTSVDVTTPVRADGVAVVITLVRKPVVNTITFRGNHAVSDDQLFRGIRLRESMALSAATLDHAVQRIRRRYADEGYDAVLVTPDVVARAPGEVDLTFVIVEGVPRRIAVIDIDGAAPVSVDEIRRALKITPGDRYTRVAERNAVKAIVRLFREQHFYEVSVRSAWDYWGEGWGNLTFTIDPGPPFRIEFSGNREFSDEELLELMDLSTRSLVTDGTWRELARRARQAYQEKGYYYARVTQHVEQESPSAPKIVRFTITEGVVYHVREVEFVGNTTLPASLLRAQMATRPPSWIPWRRGVFLDDVFDDDLKRLWYFYRRHGFEAAEIVDARTDFDAVDGKVTVTVYVEEGPQTLVHRIEPIGMESAERLPDFQTQLGEPLDPDKVEADRQALIVALGRAGYGRAAVTTDVTSSRVGSAYAATVRFEAAPGTQERVGAIVVQNDIDTRWNVLLRELPFEEGAPLDPEALLKGQNNIYRLGLFRSVTVAPLETSADPAVRDVGVSVAERPPGSLQWGLGYNTRDGFTSFGEIVYSNLQGLGRRIGLRAEFSLDPSNWTPDDYIGNLSYFAPRLADTWWSFRSNIIAQRSTRSVDQFSIERYAGIPSIERRFFADRLDKDLIGRLELQAEQAQVFNVAPDVLAFNPSDAGRLTTISLAGYGIYDGRDDPFLPTRGFFESFSVRVAPREFGSTVPFVEVLGQHAQYVPITEDLTFVYSLRGAWSRALNAGEQVPIRYRFFIGGRTTVRGYAENSIGPTGNTGSPTGGDIMVNVNTELRYPLIFGFLGAVFVDGGTVYLENCPSDTVQNCAINFYNFRRSVGLGLRYTTPVGPLGLDYGFKLDRRTGESIGEVHFSIGNIF